MIFLNKILVRVNQVQNYLENKSSSLDRGFKK
jgi:hypothetical protein